MGSVGEGGFCGKFCGNSAEALRKLVEIRLAASGKSAEILRKFCRNFAETFGKISATTPS